MSNEQPSRPRRSGSSASPMGSTLAIVIAIAAVVVGFLILKKIRSDDDTAATSGDARRRRSIRSPDDGAADSADHHAAVHQLHTDNDRRDRVGGQLVAPEQSGQGVDHGAGGQELHHG